MDQQVLDDPSKLDRLADRTPNEVKRLKTLAENVDNSILKVDLMKESNVLKTTSRESLLIRSDPGLREELEASVTPEPRLNFSGKFFKWVPIHSEALNSKYMHSNSGLRRCFEFL